MLHQILVFWALLALAQTQSTSPTPAPTDAPPATSTNSIPPAVTTTPAPTTGGGGPTSSPLLFFVALGFGVVFTNLWIIVGVKYCFRYNQRHRQPRVDEIGEPIDMAAMRRPGRRRREKKLMTMEEVNDRFPLIKYKMWRSLRESEGLPTSGGIAPAAASRAASLKDAEGTISSRDNRISSDNTVDTAQVPSINQQEKALPDITPVDPQPATESKAVSSQDDSKKEEQAAATKDASTESQQPNAAVNADTPSRTATVEDDEDEDDHIHTAVPPELLTNPGDSCAICLDTLEDDDDVRGLTCGHAFHASCLDPWLISRRACCPLCKADYYVPKPRPEGEAAAAETERVHRSRGPTASRRRGPLPALPPAAWTGGRNGNTFGSRLVMPGRFMTAAAPMSDQDRQGRHDFRQGWRRRHQQQVPPEVSYTAENEASSTAAQGGGGARRWRPRMTNPFMNDRNNMPIPRENSEVSYTATTNTNPSTVQVASDGGNTAGGWRSRVSAPFRTGWLPAIRMPGRAEAAAADGNAPPAANQNPTPGQLEAGAAR
ncbi:MAG: hypothetical protein M1817_005073 [Caeruleum heppii]|nr:MAG: hypothetical protein M1817_005073 [Caeruleum heppii]